MKILAVCIVAVSCLANLALAQGDYPLTEDSKPQAGVPQGELIRFAFTESKIFSGTSRTVTLYVPKQYDGKTSACLYVGQDGVRFEAPTVFDNLIHKQEMPVVIGVFVTPGVVGPARPGALPRFNRSLEYDGLGDAYGRFLNQELLPHIGQMTLADGRPILISSRGKDRAIGGASSGAAAAFTAAWEHPEWFGRVFSAIGTYVGLRGADRYPILIRKTEPKPIRVFLQDGSNDNNKYGGDWWMANQTMERALRFAGYEVNHAWGEGGHNARHATAVFPDAMRWLWKDWQAPISVGLGSTQTQELLIPGEGWQLVGEGYGSTDGLAANAQGDVYFSARHNSAAWKIVNDGQPELFLADNKRAGGQAFAPNGTLFNMIGREQRLVAYAPLYHAYSSPLRLAPSSPTTFIPEITSSTLSLSTSPTTVAEGIRGNDLAVAHNGNIYITESGDGTPANPSNIVLVKPSGEQRIVDTGLKFANGIALSPDQSLLYVSEYRSHWVVSWQIQDDGTLTNKLRYYHLHTPDTGDDAQGDGIEVDTDGRLYVTTNLGIQVCDQAGRVNVILPTPGGRVSSLAFGGKNFDTLYAACGDQLYKRKLKTRGINPESRPFMPAPPRL